MNLAEAVASAHRLALTQQTCCEIFKTAKGDYEIVTDFGPYPPDAEPIGGMGGDGVFYVLDQHDAEEVWKFIRAHLKAEGIIY